MACDTKVREAVHRLPLHQKAAVRRSIETTPPAVGLNNDNENNNDMMPRNVAREWSTSSAGTNTDERTANERTANLPNDTNDRIPETPLPPPTTTANNNNNGSSSSPISYLPSTPPNSPSKTPSVAPDRAPHEIHYQNDPETPTDLRASRQRLADQLYVITAMLQSETLRARILEGDLKRADPLGLRVEGGGGGGSFGERGERGSQGSLEKQRDRARNWARWAGAFWVLGFLLVSGYAYLCWRNAPEREYIRLRLREFYGLE